MKDSVTTKCRDHIHVLFMGNKGIKCAYCDYGIKMEPLGEKFEKVLNDNLEKLMSDKPQPTNEKEESIMEEIESLGHERAIFCLKALAVAGYISCEVIRKTIDLSKSIRFLHDD